jgi:hypothetical protein
MKLSLNASRHQEFGTNQSDNAGQNVIRITDKVNIIRNGKVAE